MRQPFHSSLLYDGSVLEHSYASLKMFLLLFQDVRGVRDKEKPFSFHVEQGFATLLIFGSVLLVHVMLLKPAKVLFHEL